MHSSYRHYNVVRSDQRKENLWKEKTKRHEWHKLTGQIQYPRAYERLAKFPNAVRREKRMTDMVPQTVPGRGLKSVPPVWHPAKKQTEIMKIEMIQKSFDHIYGTNRANCRPMFEPVNPVTRELIYEGVTREEEGKYAYLYKKRKYEVPEKRYKCPLTTNFEYGWHVIPIMKQFPPPLENGRGRVMEESFWRNNKVFNDPFNERHRISYMKPVHPLSRK